MDDAKKEFYIRLDELVKDFPKHDLHVIKGDLNAKVDTDNT